MRLTLVNASIILLAFVFNHSEAATGVTTSDYEESESGLSKRRLTGNLRRVQTFYKRKIRSLSSSTKSPSDSTKSPSDSTKSPSDSTKSPSDSTKSPSHSTKSPSGSTKSPSHKSNRCVLEAKLGHPFEDPDDAPYYGFHFDQLSVRRDDGQYCDALEKIQPAWCKFEKSGYYPGAYVGNVDDYYDEWAENCDKAEDITYTIDDAAGRTIKLYVSHFFFNVDYYAYYESWSDHLMPAFLTIKNKSLNTDLGPQGGWSHPVNKEVPTHIKKGLEWIPNPDYRGEFSVTVTCSESCDCNAGSYTIL